MTTDAIPQTSDAVTIATDSSTAEGTKATKVTSVTPPSSDTDDDEDYSGHDDDDIEGDVPHEFICPLTLEIFNDPLMDRRGMNFERSAIVEWLNRGHETCPLTREPLGYRSLIPNINLRMKVEHFKRENGYDVKPLEDADSERMDGRQFVFTIEAPPNSELEVRWNRNLEEQRLQQRRQDQGGSSGRRRRDVRNAQRTGFSPSTQRRRLTGLFNAIRRAPLTDS